MIWKCYNMHLCKYASKCMWAFGVDSNHHFLLNRYKRNSVVYICYDERYSYVDPDDPELKEQFNVKTCPLRKGHKITMAMVGVMK